MALLFANTPLARLQRLYERYRPELCAVARSMGADPHTAEDAVDSNMALTLIVESRETLTTEQMENYSIVVFPAEDGYYEVGYNPAQIENAWQIIQNIE